MGCAKLMDSKWSTAALVLPLHCLGAALCQEPQGIDVSRGGKNSSSGLFVSFVHEHKARTKTVQKSLATRLFSTHSYSSPHSQAIGTEALSNACQIVSDSKKLVSGCDLGQDLAALRLARLG